MKLSLAAQYTASAATARQRAVYSARNKPHGRIERLSNTFVLFLLRIFVHRKMVAIENEKLE